MATTKQKAMRLFRFDHGPWELLAGTSRTDALERALYSRRFLDSIHLASESDIAEWESLYGSSKELIDRALFEDGRLPSPPTPNSIKQEKEEALNALWKAARAFDAAIYVHETKEVKALRQIYDALKKIDPSQNFDAHTKVFSS